MSKKVQNVKVADYLSNMIAFCGKSQKEIAEEIGYPMPNIITMFKQGKTRLPLNKVPKMAVALGIDPVHLLRVVMSEYAPETWEVIDSVMNNALVTTSEASILDVTRKVSLGYEVAPESDEEKRELAELALKWRDRAEKAAEASRRRVLRDKGLSSEVEADKLERDIGVLLSS